MTTFEEHFGVDDGELGQQLTVTIIATVLGQRNPDTDVRVMSLRTPTHPVPIYHNGMHVDDGHNPTIVWLPDHNCAALTVETTFHRPIVDISPEYAGGLHTLSTPNHGTDLHNTELAAIHLHTP